MAFAPVSLAAAGSAPAVERRPVAARPPRRPRDRVPHPDDVAAARRALILGHGILRALFEQRHPDALRLLTYELLAELRGLRDRLDPPSANGRSARP